MANPLMGMMGGGVPVTNPGAAPIQNMQMLRQAAQSAKKMMGMLNGVKNPKQALMMAAQQNPQLNSVMQMVGGRDPQQVFYEECKKNGVNPEDILNQLR
ncbi:MAG: hypothetical protein HFH88_11135 [Lachnospiraceae bacterium]|nr:hypothetical protein [Lachnospiraceae bacterium]